MKISKKTIRSICSAASFALAMIAFLVGSGLASPNPEPLPAHLLLVIEGADNQWKKVETRTCAQQTLSDFNGSSDPATKAMAKGVVASCGADEVTAQSTCWTCSANPSPTHTVFTGGGSMEGTRYEATSCGKVRKGTCEMVDGTPQCNNTVALGAGFDCTAAQKPFPQFVDPRTD